MTYEEVLDMIDELLDNSSAVPFSNKKMLDCDQLADQIDQLRLSLPTEIKKAQEIMEKKDSIIAEANEEADKIKKDADKIVDEAKAKAREIVSETEIMRQAKEYAAKVIYEAQDQAVEIINEAKEKDAQIRKALSDNVNSTLIDAQSVLKANLEKITETISAVDKLNASPEEKTENAAE